MLFVLTILLFQFCTSSRKTSTGNSDNPSVTYVRDVQPLMVSHCSPCHFPPKGFKEALNEFEPVRNNIDEIIRRVSLQPGDKGFMPFKHEKLSDSSIKLFVMWKEQGLKKQ